MRRKIIVMLALVICLSFPVTAHAGQKWLGTDDLVHNKVEQVAGVSAKKPLIDISQGNLGLFVFAVGGFAAGTVFGYHWRKIFTEKAGK